MQKVTARFTLTIVAPKNSPAQEQKEPSTKRVERLLDNSVGRFGIYQVLRPLAIGLVHGLAGSAAVALLVLSTIHNPIWATAYLLIFGAGTMVGMMCMTCAIAVPLTFAGDRFAKLSRYLGTASGMVSLCFGSFLVYQLGILGGLFTAHPQWTPR
jgi:high-affinity nickel-transport protein